MSDEIKHEVLSDLVNIIMTIMKWNSDWDLDCKLLRQRDTECKQLVNDEIY